MLRITWRRRENIPAYADWDIDTLVGTIDESDVLMSHILHGGLPLLLPKALIARISGSKDDQYILLIILNFADEDEPRYFSIMSNSISFLKRTAELWFLLLAQGGGAASKFLAKDEPGEESVTFDLELGEQEDDVVGAVTRFLQFTDRKQRKGKQNGTEARKSD